MSLQRVDELFRQRGLTLALMESCTGGLLSHLVTNIAGCGDYFLGSVVSYASDVKERMGVDPVTMKRYGVVSAPTAEAMARAVRDEFGADITLAITGVAGPVPQEEVPVGIVYVAIASAGGVLDRVERYDFGDRGLEQVKQAAVDAALALLAEAIDQLDPTQAEQLK